MNEPILKLELSLPASHAAEAAEFLTKIAEYPPRAQEVALAFLRGIQFAQSVRPNA